MQYIFIALLAFLIPDKELYSDSVTLQGIDIVSSLKSDFADKEKPYSSTGIGRKEIEERHITSLKELSSIAPNFYQPDYGSRITSSIYVRGFGSRIDQPVIGMNIDEVPVMNKNNYDFELFDISEIEIIRGAQSTLYGRNTTAGTVNIKTLSPLNFQGKRFTLEYGTANTVRVKASHYAAPSDRFGWSASIHYNHSDGFFTNSYNGRKCDGGDNFATRLRTQYLWDERWSLDNSLTVGYTDEGGYAYRFYDKESGRLMPVNYNDNCSYRRLNIADGVTVKYNLPHLTVASTTGYSYTDDRMRIDNDFLPQSYFTLGQYQREHSITQEFTAKSKNSGTINWLAGLFAFYKHQKLSAPVLFKEQGIKSLILDNANKGLQTAFPGNELQFDSDRFLINDHFDTPTYGASLYGQVSHDNEHWNITAGVRIDHEKSTMDYNSHSAINFRVYPMMEGYLPLNTVFKGDNSIDATEIMPKVSLTYKHSKGSIYTSVAKGYKAGGFNTQLFSDILQSRMRSDLMGKFGVHLDDVPVYDDASATTYRPEESMNYEIGTHLMPLDDGSLNISATLFLIDCKNQQLTIFPEGMTTGRMMSNAGESRSYGAEVSMNYTHGRLRIDGSYGYTHAEFRTYRSGTNDYSGKHLPLAPRETASANISYRLPVNEQFAKHMTLNLGWNAVGRIYWDEGNTLSQPFYSLLSASLNWEKGHFGASLWGKNLLDEEYKAFYFVSMQHPFFSLGKSRQIGISLHYNL
ncbi:MAG: TonB-dependent receptor [Bacteroidaceae bacterium]|nr:TonB-dependent receptor [Bacteroidaceae bacterium]